MSSKKVYVYVFVCVHACMCICTWEGVGVSFSHLQQMAVAFDDAGALAHLNITRLRCT